jgi:hypothetical protein
MLGTQRPLSAIGLFSLVERVLSSDWLGQTDRQTHFDISCGITISFRKGNFRNYLSPSVWAPREKIIGFTIRRFSIENSKTTATVRMSKGRVHCLKFMECRRGIQIVFLQRMFIGIL